MQVKKQQLELDVDQQTGSKLVKEYVKAVYCHLHAEYIMRNAGLDEAKDRIKIAGKNINNLRYADDNNLMAESEEELKSLLMKEKSEKSGLKLNIQKTKIMASSLITSWQIDGGTMEIGTDFFFFFWPPKSLQMVTAAMKLKEACSLEENLWPTYTA